MAAVHQIANGSVPTTKYATLNRFRRNEQFCFRMQQGVTMRRLLNCMRFRYMKSSKSSGIGFVERNERSGAGKKLLRPMLKEVT